MSDYSVKLSWKRNTPEFIYKEYSRDHTLDFGNGNVINASSSPEYFGNAEFIDPEQAFIASLTSCHMLTFLAIACKKRFSVIEYSDSAVGVLEENDNKKTVITQINLCPKVVFDSEKVPTEEQFKKMHDQAHEYCFIANTIKDCVRVSINAAL